ncbi:Uncharacterized protein OS=Cellulophaga algicola (strain DSM 14237 / IC166 / ACAM 630) GN=Celal_0150 PE=4 SV=1 [Gemmata massiliana]|uniref:Uncharacterized protein n=1 Tax=Gemmata massiliana TaxID=1210884 RepID=A0A6P2CRP8_9BACT|nr:hypothetical protein [Gemmata massiliana]VTR91006.1 Uncharacterized protein OS=Cellulophaga algicola (strain DSM 14237 / IC166 / ACAM 630) GN=Celal_0150 PE=4 SV=1 [Gemmata massiliana]
MDEFAEQVARTAMNVVEMSEVMSYGVLDYSESSLALLEQMAEEVAGYFEDMTTDQRETASQQFGCYILEVGRRQFGGRYAWFEQRNQPVLIVGEPTFRVAMITWDKVLGRLSGDSGDNIPFFYSGFAERVRRAEPGTDALYV